MAMLIRPKHLIAGALVTILLGASALALREPISLFLTRKDPGFLIRKEYNDKQANIKARGSEAQKNQSPPLLQSLSQASPSSTPGSKIILLKPDPVLDFSGQNVSPSSSNSQGQTDYYNRPSNPGVQYQVDSGNMVPGDALRVTPERGSAPPVPDALLSQNMPNETANGQGASANAVGMVEPRRYLFNNQAPSAISTEGVVFSAPDRASSDISVQHFAPIGEEIELALVDAIASNNFELDVRAGVWNPFYFGGRKLLDIGDQVLGKAAPGKSRDRVIVKFYKIKFKDGKTLPITAVAKAPDGTEGIPGYMVGSRTLQAIIPVLLSATSGLVEVFKDRSIAAYVPSRLTAAGVTVETNNPQSRSGQLQDAGYSMLQSGLDRISMMVAQDVEENKPFLVVPPGTLCKAYLNDYIDTSRADLGK